MNVEKSTYDTLVIEGMGECIPQEVNGLRVVAWSSGHAVNEKTEMEEFIRNLSFGDYQEPEQAAIDLMERMGWA